MLSGGRGLAVRRAALQAQTPWIVRLFAARRRGTPAAATRAAAALARLAAAAARRFHGGAVLRSAEPQQLAPYSELVSLLGRLLGELTVIISRECVRVRLRPPRPQPAALSESFNILETECNIGNRVYVKLFTILKTEVTTEKYFCLVCVCGYHRDVDIE